MKQNRLLPTPQQTTQKPYPPIVKQNSEHVPSMIDSMDLLMNWATDINTELPNGFADTLSMNDLFHMLPGDADIRFVQEAARILKEKGRCAIAPIHLGGSYVNIVDPWSDLRNIPIDNGAKRIWKDDGRHRGAVFIRS